MEPYIITYYDRFSDAFRRKASEILRIASLPQDDNTEIIFLWWYGVIPCLGERDEVDFC